MIKFTTKNLVIIHQIEEIITSMQYSEYLISKFKKQILMLWVVEDREGRFYKRKMNRKNVTAR